MKLITENQKKSDNIYWNKILKKFNMAEPMVRGKDTLMSDEMEEFIIDTIIIAKVKNEGERHAD